MTRAKFSLFPKINYAIKRFIYYLKIWWLLNIKYMLPVVYTNWTFSVFLIGKVIRFIFFGGFIFFLVKGTNTLAGYSLNETLLFYASFMFIDTAVQFLFREVYRFRPQIISGTFDFVLLKPMSPLFRVLLGGADPLDLVTLPVFLYFIYRHGSLLNPSPEHVAFFVLLLFNSFLIGAAFHIAVLAVGIISLEIDHTVMIYRDIESLGRFPIDIYREPLRSVLTYFVPIGMMISFPVKAMLGLLTPWGITLSLAFGTTLLIASLQLWNFALKKYTSASS